MQPHEPSERRGAGRTTPAGPAVAGLFAVILVLAACGADDEPLDAAAPPDGGEPTAADGDDGASSPDDDASASSPDDGDDRGGASGADRDQGDRSSDDGGGLVAWLLGLGPSAPSGPSEFRAYQLLEDGDCQGLLDRFDPEHPDRVTLGDSEALYRATAAACLAAFDGHDDLWRQAQSDAAVAGTGSASCLDRTVREVLDGLLAAHDADPEAPLSPATDPGVAHAPPCPTITRLSPTEGPLGTEVRLTGRHLGGDDLEVHLVLGPDLGTRVVPHRVDGGELVIGIDVDEAAERICVALHTTPDWYADGATFHVQEVSSEDDDPDEVEDPGETDPDVVDPDTDGDEGTDTADEDPNGHENDAGEQPGDPDGEEEAEGALTGTRLVSFTAPTACPPVE